MCLKKPVSSGLPDVRDKCTSLLRFCVDLVKILTSKLNLCRNAATKATKEFSSKLDEHMRTVL